MLLIPIGIFVIWLMLSDKPSAIEMVPGFIIIGIGIGFANAPLLNMVQSSVPAEKQGEISGLNRAMSNLGGSLGTAVAGAVLISVLISSFSGLVLSNQVIPQPEKERIEAALDKDARTVSNTEAEKYLAEKSYQTDIKNALFGINQTARNKALLYALLAVGIIGIIGFIFSLFLPKGNSP